MEREPKKSYRAEDCGSSSGVEERRVSKGERRKRKKKTEKGERESLRVLPFRITYTEEQTQLVKLPQSLSGRLHIVG